MVQETGKPIAQVARELGINGGTLGNWCTKDRRQREGSGAALSEEERAELGAAAAGAQPSRLHPHGQRALVKDCGLSTGLMCRSFQAHPSS